MKAEPHKSWAPACEEVENPRKSAARSSDSRPAISSTGVSDVKPRTGASNCNASCNLPIFMNDDDDDHDDGHDDDDDHDDADDDLMVVLFLLLVMR